MGTVNKAVRVAADEWMSRPDFLKRGAHGFADDVASEDLLDSAEAMGAVLNLVASTLESKVEEYRRVAKLYVTGRRND